MYKKIIVPIDMEHIEKLDKAIQTAADLAKSYGATVCFVGVTPETPTSVAHTPHEYAQKLRDFGNQQSQAKGIAVETAAIASHDPAVDLRESIMKAAADHGGDLIVMASHLPGLVEHVFSSNAGAIASHAEISVFVVR